MLQNSSADAKAFDIRNFRLQSGIVMPSVSIAYRTSGVLAPDRGNVVLVTHGNTSGPQMIDPGGSTGEGSWNEIVGPGKAVDTDRFFARTCWDLPTAQPMRLISIPQPASPMDRDFPTSR